VTTASDQLPGTPKRLFSTDGYLRGFAIAHDDLRFLMVRSTSTESRQRLSVFENWPSAMRRK
jgi:hypothetical protein